MRSHIFAICFAIASMLSANAFSQECVTCTESNPCNACNACATCKPCELFGGLKNLMSCRPCAAPIAPVYSAPMAVAPACGPIIETPACAPVAAAPSCDVVAGAPIYDTCAPAPCWKPKFRRLINFFPKTCGPACGGCGVCDACAPIAPSCDTCGDIAPARPIFGAHFNAAPTCDTCTAAPVCDMGCAAPACAPILPCLKNAVRVPLVGIRDAFNGLFTTLAEATAPRCVGDCGLATCSVCTSTVDFAPACAPVSYEPSCNGSIPSTVISTQPAAAPQNAAAPLPPSPTKVQAPAKTK